jgi:DNA repair protein RadA/Sms
MGKSTLLLQLANSLSLKGYKILYASGEESNSQIKNRADRTVKELADNFWVVSDTKLDEILQHIETVDADIIILDSIQTFTLEEYSSSRAGSPTQVIECATALKDKAKNPDRPRAVFLVGQMTKADEMAGPRILEHLVDTVLYIEGEDGEELKHLISKKNRYGDTSESGLFRMSEIGMEEITDPSEFFMTKREELVPGSALAVIKDGTRPIVVEVESLVSKSFTPYPSRLSECFARKEQLGTLISILEERGGVGLYDKNVIIKATGGLKLTETSVNLAVVMSIASSALKQGISTDTVFIGELGLTGELKKVPSLEQRLKEVDRMGFKKAYIPMNCFKTGVKFKNIKLIPCKKLTDVIEKEFK